MYNKLKIMHKSTVEFKNLFRTFVYCKAQLIKLNIALFIITDLYLTKELHILPVYKDNKIVIHNIINFFKKMHKLNKKILNLNYFFYLKRNYKKIFKKTEQEAEFPGG